MPSDDDRERAPTLRAPEVLADRLRALILDGDFELGDLLPPERDLCVDSGLSRGSTREALRILETEGLVRMRTGRSGGAVVTAPARRALARSVEIFIRANAIDLDALLDCRLAVEPMLARLAAEHRKLAELQAMRDLHGRFAESTTNTGLYRMLNFEWHLSVARASRNEPLMALMEAIATPVLAATGYASFTTPVTRNDAVRDHAVVMAAIGDRDPDAAAAGMERHLRIYKEMAGSILRTAARSPSNGREPAKRGARPRA